LTFGAAMMQRVDLPKDRPIPQNGVGSCGRRRTLPEKGSRTWLAKAMIITKRDLHDLSVNCGVLGLSHYAKHLEFVPDQRRLTAEDNNAIFNLDGSRTPETLGKATSRVTEVASS
jgi:hypothetical protein